MTPVWYAAKVNSPRLWLAWLLLCLLALAAPAQALNGLKLPISAFSPGSKRACTAKSFRVDCPINMVDPTGLDPRLMIYVTGIASVSGRSWKENLASDLQSQLGVQVDFRMGTPPVSGWYETPSSKIFNLQLNFDGVGTPTDRGIPILGYTPDGGAVVNIYTKNIDIFFNTKPIARSALENMTNALEFLTSNTIKHEIGHALTKLGDEAENGVGWVRKIADQPNGSVMDYSDFLKYGVFGHMLPYSPSMLTIIRTNFGLPAGGVLPASPYR